MWLRLLVVDRLVAIQSERLTWLDRLNARRERGVSTLCTLVGPAAETVTSWQDWGKRNERPVCLSVAESLEAVLTHWMHVLAETSCCEEVIHEYLADQLGESSQRVRHHLQVVVGPERELFFQRVAEVVSESVCRICRWGIGDSPGENLSPILITDGMPSLEGVFQLFPPERLPALLVQVQSTDSLQQAVRKARLTVALVTAHPEMTVGLAIEKALYEQLLGELGDSFEKAVLQDAVCELFHQTNFPDDVPEESLNPTNLLSAVFSESPPLELQQSLQQVRTAEKLAQEKPESLELAEGARSAAEAFLFELLEACPQTRGLFRLNVKPGGHFGKKSLELDLACESMKVVVEVDGYFHFLSPEAYRRDRRKDWELQKRGYLVLRFLAEDVVPRMDAVLQTICDGLNFRRQGN